MFQEGREASEALLREAEEFVAAQPDSPHKVLSAEIPFREGNRSGSTAKTTLHYPGSTNTLSLELEDSRYMRDKDRQRRRPAYVAAPVGRKRRLTLSETRAPGSNFEQLGDAAVVMEDNDPRRFLTSVSVESASPQSGVNTRATRSNDRQSVQMAQTLFRRVKERAAGN